MRRGSALTAARRGGLGGGFDRRGRFGGGALAEDELDGGEVAVAEGVGADVARGDQLCHLGEGPGEGGHAHAGEGDEGAEGRVGDPGGPLDHLLEVGAALVGELAAGGGEPLPEQHADPVFVGAHDGKAGCDHLGGAACHVAEALAPFDEAAAEDGVAQPLFASEVVIEELLVASCETSDAVHARACEAVLGELRGRSIEDAL